MPNDLEKTARGKVLNAIQSTLRDGDYGIGAVGHPTLAADLADAVLEALGSQTEHIAEVRATSWVIKHPLDCREDIFNCIYNRAVARPYSIPMNPGRYMVTFGEDGYLNFAEYHD